MRSETGEWKRVQGSITESREGVQSRATGESTGTGREAAAEGRLPVRRKGGCGGREPGAELEGTRRLGRKGAWARGRARGVWGGRVWGGTGSGPGADSEGRLGRKGARGGRGSASGARAEGGLGRMGCYSYSRGVQTERLLREQKHNFGACLRTQRKLGFKTGPILVLIYRFLSWHLVFLASRPVFGVAWGIRPPASYNMGGWGGRESGARAELEGRLSRCQCARGGRGSGDEGGLGWKGGCQWGGRVPGAEGSVGRKGA
jgi:hypothetical protein